MIYKYKNKTDSTEAWETPEGILFVAASHQTRLDTRSKARRPIKVKRRRVCSFKILITNFYIDSPICRKVSYNFYVLFFFLDTKVFHFHLGKTKMASEEIDPRPHKYWPSWESLKAYRQKTNRRHYYLSTLPRPSIPSTEERWNKSY